MTVVECAKGIDIFKNEHGMLDEPCRATRCQIN